MHLQAHQTKYCPPGNDLACIIIGGKGYMQLTHSKAKWYVLMFLYFDCKLLSNLSQQQLFLSSSQAAEMFDRSYITVWVYSLFHNSLTKTLILQSNP